MTRALRYSELVCLLLAACLLPACSHRSTQGNTLVPAIYAVSDTAADYNITFSWGGQSQTGILTTRLVNDTARLVCTTPFGMTLFDLSLSSAGYSLHRCIVPLQNTKAWEVLAADFRAVFLASRPGNGKPIARVTGNAVTRGTIRYDSTNHTTVIRHKWLKLEITLAPITHL